MSLISTIRRPVRGADTIGAICGRIIGLRDQLTHVDIAPQERGDIVDLVAGWRMKLALSLRPEGANPVENEYSSWPIDVGGEG